ncbi:MAG TPA: AbrB/MazE/SpoVT family DNA-binding domain-containing protein [Alphaproteobacteria bacterium]|nr:AbrB/MazE/SpoVT family DNA-binding domain-containing protein [Alphaproteobacteria bacterium]
MKRYAKIIQSDKRGQIVIPKDVRRELNLDEGAGFYLYIIENEGILLKTIPSKELSDHSHIIKEIEINADKINIKKQNIKSSVESYKKKSKGNFENLT